MTSEDERNRRRLRRERNLVAKELRERKFHQRIIPDKKREKRLSIRDYYEEE